MQRIDYPLSKETFDAMRKSAHEIVDRMFDRATPAEDGTRTGELYTSESKRVRAIDYEEEGELLTRFEATGEMTFTLTYRPTSV